MMKWHFIQQWCIGSSINGAVQCTVYSIQCGTVYTIQYPVRYSVQCTEFNHKHLWAIFWNIIISNLFKLKNKKSWEYFWRKEENCFYIFETFLILLIYLFLLISTKYRVTHKGWDCKEDLKLLKSVDSKGILSTKPWI